MSISRRKFAQLLGAGAAAAVARPALSLARTPVNAVSTPLPSSAMVRLGSNENPWGPSLKAVEAMREAFGLVWRYPDEQADGLIAAIGKETGATRDQVLLGDGSSQILKLCADAFTGPKGKTSDGITLGPAVVADPTFEALAYHASRNGAEIIKVPLTADYRHDLPKMRAAAKQGGLVYLCNPNNPTATVTPREQVRDFVATMPETTMMVVDEAYFHYVDDPDYESAIPLVNDHPNLIVTRTFSKVYGLAGARVGYCLAQSYTIERLRTRQSWDSLNTLGIAAARASLEDPDKVPEERRRNAETRAYVIAELKKLGHETIPSQTNFIMFNANRPVVPLIASLRDRRVEVGRLFRAMPNYLRVTVGKRAEMEKFLQAFREISPA